MPVTSSEIRERLRELGRRAAEGEFRLRSTESIAREAYHSSRIEGVRAEYERALEYAHAVRGEQA